MLDWNSVQYKKFIEQRSQPAKDLAMRILAYNPKKIIDIGCGPGNSTKILHEIYPQASIVGIDSSPNMIAKAKEDNPDLDFCICDALSLVGHYDIIYSNACLHWIPNHQIILPVLMDKLNVGGCLAVQMPYNNEAPLYRIINEIVADSKWGFDNSKLANNLTLTVNEYYKILSSCTSSFDIWETKYYHSMPNHRALIEWVKSAKLRPYLDCLSDDKGKELENKIIERAEQEYPVMSDGNIIFEFNRLFFTAKR